MDLEKMKQFRNDRNRYGLRMGITVEDLAPGWARVVKTVTEEDLNPVDVPHGGVYFSMADTAAGTAMITHGHAAVTVSCSFNFMRSAKVGDRLVAEATETKSGRTLCVYDVTVKDQDGTLLSTGTFTFFRMEQKLDV